MNRYIPFIICLCSSLLVISCAGGGNDSPSVINNDGGDDSYSEAFPTGLAVASPFDTEEVRGRNYKAPSYTSNYVWATARIEAVLQSGSTPSLCIFDPALFLSQGQDALCYGPTLLYEDHPDAVSPPDDGELPPGDLGMWEATVASGEACATAQLNTRLDGVREQSLAALMGLASMICTAEANSIWPPAAGTALDLLDSGLSYPMTATDVVFTTATISRDATGDIWDYELDFVYTDGSLNDHHIVAYLSHENGSTVGVYQGRLSYQANDTFAGGNCSGPDATINGSLVYQRNSNTDMALQSRSAIFCGSDADGMTSTGIVDPSRIYPDYSDGWANSFNILTAEFDPSNLSGQYSYVWQAGPQDSHSRVFNVGVNDNDPIDGESYFGFGDTVGTTNGSVQGFICNWAGPGNNHTLQAYSQRQHIAMDTILGLVIPTNNSSSSSNITYAPTNTCAYDGSGTFLYDRNLDSSLLDESSSTVVVTDPVTVVLELDLYAATSGLTMWETIQNRGYTLPTAPSYSNPYTH